MKINQLLIAGLAVFAVSSCQKPQPNACIEAGSAKIYQFESATFTSCSEDAETYTWDFGNGTTGDGEEGTVTFNENKQYLVTLETVSKNEKLRNNATLLVDVLYNVEGSVKQSMGSTFAGHTVPEDGLEWYIDVTAGTTYVFYWDDSWDGSGSYTADILVEFNTENGDYLGQGDSGFNGVTVEADYTGRMFLTVLPYSDTDVDGTFGFYYTTM